MSTFEKLAALTLATASVGCGFSTTTYAEIEVRDPGRVGVGTLGARGVEPVLPPDGSDRVAQVPAVSGRVLARRGREIVLGAGGQPPVTLVDERGILPRVPSGSGIEVREQTLWATYNVTPTRVLPQEDRPRLAVPVVLSTEMSNVVDAREVKQVNHTAAQVCLPIALVLAAVGTQQMFFTEDRGVMFGPDYPKIIGGGVPYVAAAALVIYSVINLTSPSEIKPLAIPGAKPVASVPPTSLADRAAAAR